MLQNPQAGESKFQPPYVGKKRVIESTHGFQVYTYGHNGWLHAIVPQNKIQETLDRHAEIIAGQESCN